MGFVGENVKILFKAAGSKYVKCYLQFCLFHCVLLQFKALFCLWCSLLVNKTFICSYPCARVQRNAQSSGKILSLNCREKKKNLLVLNFFFPLQQGHNVHKLQKRNESSLQTVRAGGRKREEIYRHQPAASADAGAFPAVPLLLSLLWSFCQQGLLLMASVQCGVRRGVREQHQGQTAGV